MKRIFTIFLALVMIAPLVKFASADSAPDVFRNDIAPHGYTTSKSFSARHNGTFGIVSASASGRSVSLERHNALIAAGWEFGGVKVTQLSDADLIRMGIDIANTKSDVIIEDTKVVESYYVQPRKSRTTYNSVLLDGIMNYSRAITTVISSAIPKAKWVPAAFGFTARAIVEASANEKTTFESTSTLRFFEIEVKIEGWPYYFTCASSEKLEVASLVAASGYKEDGTPFTRSGDGFASSKSAHYGNTTWLTLQARTYAYKNDGSWYSESYPEIDAVEIAP